MPVLTARVKLKPTPEQAVLFRATASLFARGCNLASKLALAAKQFYCGDVQKLSYADLKAEGLGAQHACLVARVVADAYKTGDEDTLREFRENGAVPMDVRTYSIKGGLASLWTTEGRQKVSFECGDKQEEILKGKHKQADLVFSRGEWYLMVSCEVEASPAVEPVVVLGIDLGIVNLAVDSTGEVFSGEQVAKVRVRRAKARETFQKKGTRSAKKRLRKLSGKEKRFQKWANHNISKRLVDKASKEALRIALEDLTGLGKKKETAHKGMRKLLGGWAFFQMRAFIEYKAALAGVEVVLVEAAYSSQTCSSCGHREKANRVSREEFSCVACSHRSCADLNAALVIGARGTLNCPRKCRPKGQMQSPRL